MPELERPESRKGSSTGATFPPAGTVRFPETQYFLTLCKLSSARLCGLFHF